ncbi:acetoacetate decarboxylase [Streptomyces sp. MMG1121]|uniref:acetoacetate decarboxylase n=1 Tax=Streptomyces sp. MMG1121 TaxID=1415544 RepID=UPI0006B003FD|nr:acetoacetate decarboxylase [Streptomyces sp. MMG1121]KOV60397.1 acetoacetate decarboxylase [Streptomyces sp. MMG1121]
MKIEDVRRHPTTPLTSPAYPPVMPWFTDREYLNIVYRTDLDALRAVVPEPLEIEEPLVRFEIMKMNDVTGCGPYTEAGQAIPVSFDGESGEYLHAMYLDNFPATAAGREVSAYPKAMASPKLYVDNDVLVGTLDYGTLRVATATMGYKHYQLHKREAEAEITVPTFMLKTVPGYDGTPRVQELARTQITDVVVKAAHTAPARLQLFQHVLAPLADLPVLEVVSASHILTDLALAPVKPVFDYLKEGNR